MLFVYEFKILQEKPEENGDKPPAKKTDSKLPKEIQVSFFIAYN